MTGCTTNMIKCKIEQSVVDVVVPGISRALQCSNVDAITSDIQKVIGQVGFCVKTNAPEGTKQLSLPVCDALAQIVIDNVAKFAIPTSWGCTAANAKDLLKAQIVKGCVGI